jgi:hypothetical protein
LHVKIVKNSADAGQASKREGKKRGKEHSPFPFPEKGQGRRRKEERMLGEGKRERQNVENVPFWKPDAGLGENCLSINSP